MTEGEKTKPEKVEEENENVLDDYHYNNEEEDVVDHIQSLVQGEERCHKWG